MDNDDKYKSLEDLERRLNKSSDDDGSIWNLVNSVHSSRKTRALIPLEAVALQPFFTDTATGKFILLLFCVERRNAENNVFFSPCGCVAWSYPDFEIAKYVDLKDAYRENSFFIGKEAIATKITCDELENFLRGNGNTPLAPNPLGDIYIEIFEKYLKTPVHEETKLQNIPSARSEQSTAGLLRLMNDTKQLITELKADFLSNVWKNIYKKMHDSGFTVAVVGEFSRGKSTLINKILGNDILPVSNLPTTAMLTKISHAAQSGIEHILPDGKSQSYPLEISSWEELVVNLFDDSPEGVVRVGLHNEWLKKTGLQIIDTPGAGDLSDKRSALVNDAIVGCDGAVIVVSAAMALSLTEKAFIEQHIIAKKVPHIMVVLSKMDQVPEKERGSVVDYVRDKLNSWGMNVPVYIPQENLIPYDAQYDGMSGIQAIKAAIESWIVDSQHIELKNKSFCAQLQDLLYTAKGMLTEEKSVMHMTNDEKLRALKEQQNKIDKLGLRWEEYRLQMLKRSNACSEWLRKTVEEKQDAIIDRLQFELTHTQNPKSWWENDLPYRLKQEMSNVARGMEDTLVQMFARDLQWLNETISKDFSSFVSVDRPASADAAQIPPGLLHIELKDTNKIRMFMRIGAGVTTVIGFTLFGPFGIAASVGGGIISEILMGKNIEKQKEELQKLVGSVVGKAFGKAMETSEKRIEGLYDKAVVEASRQERIWVRAQSAALRKSAPVDKDAERKLDVKLQAVQEIIDRTNIFIRGYC